MIFALKTSDIKGLNALFTIKGNISGNFCGPKQLQHSQGMSTHPGRKDLLEATSVHHLPKGQSTHETHRQTVNILLDLNL